VDTKILLKSDHFHRIDLVWLRLHKNKYRKNFADAILKKSIGYKGFFWEVCSQTLC